MESCDFIEPFVLGIDLGTTTVKVTILDSTGCVVENATVLSAAAVLSDVGINGYEQSPQVIWNSLISAIQKLQSANQAKV